MNKERFEIEYNNKGGINTLNELREKHWRVSQIANHFGVSQSTIREWMKTFYGCNYDPRRARREALIKRMIDYAKEHTIIEFEKMFGNCSDYYKKQAIKVYEQ